MYMHMYVCGVIMRQREGGRERETEREREHRIDKVKKRVEKQTSI